MGFLNIAGRYLDQPILVAKFKKKVPYILTGAAAVYGAHKIYHTKPEDKKKQAIKTGATLACTISSALLAPQIANKMFNIKTTSLKQIKEYNTKIINDFYKQKPIENKKVLEKAKTKILSYKEIKQLNNESNTQQILEKLIPEPENISSKDIFAEIGRLSVLGFIPVIGGIFGGILGDRLAQENWKGNIPNKIKEGAYQYLANIFLCNVGAGLALALMEKAGVKSKTQRALGMTGGIATTGIFGGSLIANVIGNRIINPLFGAKPEKSLYSERKPEALDIGLHVDDIATVAVMSGLKWIEPALPIMYAISGYRAGIGYRNVNKCNEKKHL